MIGRLRELRTSEFGGGRKGGCELETAISIYLAMKREKGWNREDEAYVVHEEHVLMTG
jgi:hypothetical protein